jgi:antitoxin component YwqK of YwqJK toxin-antitoxin module
MKKINLLLFLFFAKFILSQSYFYKENSKKQNGDVVYIYSFNKGYSYTYNCSIYPEYIDGSNIYDWRKSIKKIELSDTKFINNINSLANGNYNGSYFVVEHCSLKNGIKNGPFTLSLCYLKNIDGKISIQESQGKLNLLESGEYLNGEYHGTIKSLNLLNYQSPCSLGEATKYDADRHHLPSPKWDFLNIVYKNGVIQDQKIIFQSDYYSTGKIVDQTGVTEFTGFYRPWVEFENGKVKKILTINGWYNLPVYKTINGNITTVYSYTLTPVCWNWYSFFSEEDKKKNKEKPFVDFGNNYWNKKQLFLEVYTMNNQNFELNGEFKIYYGMKHPSHSAEGVLFNDMTNPIKDTVGCKIAATYSYKNGKRNGEAKIFNGNGTLAYSIFYENDMLHGKSEHFFDNGKTAFIINFSKGLPDGEAISYFNPSSKVPLLSVSGKSEHLVGGVFLPQSIIKWNEEKNIQSMVQTIKENGGDITQLNNYQMISKVNYQIDSIKLNNGSWERFSHPDGEYSIFNNGKPMRRHKIDFKSNYKSKIVDWDYLDQDGKVVYTKAQEDQAKKENSQNEAEGRKKQQEEFENSLQRCQWCNKEVVYKNGIITDDEIKCNKSLYGISGLLGVRAFVCSNACKASYEEDKCRRNAKN